MSALAIAATVMIGGAGLCAGIAIGVCVNGDRRGVGQLAAAMTGFCGAAAVAFYWLAV